MLYLEGLLLGAHCLILPHAVFRGVIIGGSFAQLHNKSNSLCFYLLLTFAKKVGLENK